MTWHLKESAERMHSFLLGLGGTVSNILMIFLPKQSK